MEKVEQFRQHAARCRRLATTMEAGEHRQALLDAADAWERLARERQERIGPPDEKIRSQEPQDLTSENDG